MRAYPGPKRPASEVATLAVPSSTILVVDDQVFEGDRVSRVELTPGSHVIEWEFVYPNRFAEVKRLRFVAEPGSEYELDQRFFPVPYDEGPLELVFDLALDATIMPLAWIFPPEAAPDAPEGEYFMWIVDRRSNDLAAGLPPDVPQAPATISYVPVVGQ